MAQHIHFPSGAADEPLSPPTRQTNWRLLMEEPPTDELFGWAVLVLLAFAPPIGWLLASFFREMFG